MSDTEFSNLSAALADIVAGAAPSIVAVHSHRALSSGFAWRPDLVVTADEALADEGDIAVTLPGGERRKAVLVGRDPTTDVALLRVENAGLPPVRLDPAPLRAGALALALGAQDGASLVAFGAVSVAGPAWRSMRGGDIAARIELDLKLRRQAEGALVLDAAGHGVGMAVYGPRRRTLVIPAATVERVAALLETHGRIPRGYLGLGLQPVRVAGDRSKGAMVMSIDAAGPGAAAGVRQGDVIVSLDGQPLAGVGALMRALGPDSVGRTVVLGLRRAGEALDLPVTIAERPQA